MSPNPNIPPPPFILKPEELVPYREPGELQPELVVQGQEMLGFEDCRVFLTMEQKKSRLFNQSLNEDNILTDPETGLFGVMDGLGGETKGDLGSKAVERMMPETFADELTKLAGEDAKTIADEIVKRQLPKTIGVGDPKTIEQQAEEMRERIAQADPALARKALALLRAFDRLNIIVEGTGGMTTACIGMVHKTPDGKRYAVVANLGDSGAVIRRQDGSVERLTHEDSVMDNMVRQGVKVNGIELLAYLERGRHPITGRIKSDYPVPVPITPESCRSMNYTQDSCDKRLKKGEKYFTLDYHMLTNMVASCLGGHQPVAPSLEIVELKSGEELVLCTDGILDKYEGRNVGETDYAELANDLDVGKTPEERLDNLRAMARQRMTYKIEDDAAIVLVSIT